MPISIKNDEAELLARRLAELTGETITEAIRRALKEKYDRVKKSGRPTRADLNEIALRCARRPLVSDLRDEEILGYDEGGAPTR